MGQNSAARLRERIVRVLSDPANDVLDYPALAVKLKIKVESLESYLTADVFADARALRCKEVDADDLKEIDHAMLLRAREGHVLAARTIYERVRERGAGGDMLDAVAPTLDDMEAELKKLREER